MVALDHRSKGYDMGVLVPAGYRSEITPKDDGSRTVVIYDDAGEWSSTVELPADVARLDTPATDHAAQCIDVPTGPRMSTAIGSRSRPTRLASGEP